MKKTLLFTILFMILYSIAILISINVQYYVLSGIVCATLAVVLAEITFAIYKPRYRTERFWGSGEFAIQSAECRLYYKRIIPLLMSGRLFLANKKMLFIPNNAIEFSNKTLTIELDAIISIAVTTSFFSHKILIEEKDQTHQFIMSRFKDKKNVNEALSLLRQMGAVSA